MGRTRKAPSLLTSYNFLPKFVSQSVLTLIFTLSFPNAHFIGNGGGSVGAVERPKFSSAHLITGRPLTASTNAGYFTSQSSFSTESPPKIKINQYRVKSNDPYIITDELKCIGTECDELVEPQTKVRLGEAENEIDQWFVPPNVTQIVIECQSKSGLVEWDYEGQGDLYDIEMDTNRFVGDFWAKSSYTYVSTLRFRYISDQLTGRYICRNVDRPSNSNSFYMFVPQEYLPIYDEGESVDVTPPNHATEVIIPCRLPARKTSIYLLKRRGNGSYREVPPESGLTFDPYVGFRLPVSRDVFGSYACKVDKKRRKQRDISLAMTPPPPPPEIPDISSSPASTFTNTPLSTIDEQFSNVSAVNSSQMRAPSAVRPPGSNIRLKRRRKRPLLPWRNHHGPPHLLRNNGIGQIGPIRRAGGPLHPRRGVFFHMRRPPHHQLIGPSNNPLAQAPPVNQFPGGFPFNRFNTPLFNPFLSHAHPSMAKPVKVLPTYSNVGGDDGERQGGLFLNPASSFSEEKPSSHENVQHSSSEVMASRIDTNVGGNGNNGNIAQNGQKLKQAQPPKRGNVFPPLFPPNTNVMQTMQCMLKKVLLGFDTPCSGISNFENRVDTNKDKTTILEVNVLPPPQNKFFPRSSVIYTTVPFFVKWQTRFTDYADWAEINHTLQEGTYKRHKANTFEDGINSLEVFNLNEGDSGEISVNYMGERKEILTHTWKYIIINNTIYNSKGLKQMKDVKSVYSVFRCKSTSTSIPKLTLTPLSEDGCPLDKKSEYSKGIIEAMDDYSVEDCGTGCALLRTQSDSGLVECVGDGVDEKIRFPPDLYCTGRPFFIERGKEAKNITIEEKTITLILPCIVNNVAADVYLFKRSINGTFTDITDLTTFKQGFRLNVNKVDDPYGMYFCTSTTDLNDDTDKVMYNVIPAPDFIFHPPSKRIYGVPPFKFMWESKEELVLQNSSAGRFYSGIFANSDHNRVNVGTFEVTALNVPPGESGEITVVKASDGEVVHTWFYKHSKKPGLWLDKDKNVFKCQSTSDFRPKLYAVECSIPNVCKLKERFIYNDESLGRDTSNCGIGCSQLKIWGNKPTGFVVCKGDGVDETSQYFLAQNSTILTNKDNLEMFKTPVITNFVRKLRVGEMTSFSCSASKYFYSKGFQWAVETREGSKTFIDQKLHEDDSFLNEIKSEINLRIADANWKAVWCYAPLIESTNWGNVSQPLYIKS